MDIYYKKQQLSASNTRTLKRLLVMNDLNEVFLKDNELSKPWDKL